MSLKTFSSRSLTSRMGRTVLTIVSIVIGVAAVVSVSVITNTTRAAYKMMFATVTGNATLEVSVPGNTGFEGDVLEKVRSAPGVDMAVPLLERNAAMLVDEKRIKLSVLGIDTKLDPAVRDYKIVEGRMCEIPSSKDKPHEILLDEGFTRQLGLKVGDEVTISGNNGRFKLQIVGLAKPQGGSSMRQMALAMVPLERAQAMLQNRRVSRTLIDSIQIVTRPGLKLEDVMAAIQPQLPEGVRVHQPTGDTQLMKRTLASTEQSLYSSTIFSCVLSIFIILNTFFMNVGERRRQISILRAIGATSRQLMGTLLKEAVLLGAIGTVIGIPLGLAMAYGLNRSMSRGFDVILPDPQISWLPLLLAPVLGIGVALVGAFVPALRAGQVSPLEGMSRVSKQDMEGTSVFYLILGAILVVVGCLIIYLGIKQVISIMLPPFGAVALLVGVVFLSPPILEPLISIFSKLLSPFTRIEGVMAERQILRHRLRTQLTIGVLFVAACIGIGMANSIKDNIRDLADWKDAALTSDFFVRSMMPDMSTGLAPDLPDEVGSEIAKIPELRTAQVERIVFVKADAIDKDGVEHSVRVVARDFADPRPPSFDIVEGSIDGLREKLFDGQAVIGSVLASDLDIGPGDEFELITRQGPAKVKVAAVANDYLVAGLSVHVQRRTAERLLEIEGVDGYTVKVADTSQLEPVRKQLEKITQTHGLLLQSNADISWSISAMVAGVEVGLWALVYVAFLVAMIGVVNTLTMNVLEQTRELSMLRIIAMTKAQVRKTILTQALLIGMSGLAPGILSGLVVAYVMNIAMEPALGRKIQFHFYPELLAGALVGALAITLIAAWFPARRAANVDIGQALHYD
jgi:putative ABC transport system permease protein